MISLIIPTYNESKNIVPLIHAVQNEFKKASIYDYEILVMDDDSPDGTSDKVNALKDSRVASINRKGRPRGLSAAVIDGFKEAKGDVLGVMDADLSHPVEALPALARAIEAGENIAVGSRYIPGGGISNWPWKRRVTSRVACYLVRPITSVKDATSGFFFIRRSALEGVSLSPLGFKIGLEVFVKAKHGGKVREVPYVFTDRREGQSKFGMRVTMEYLKQVVLLAARR